jgi:hypothetical protein
MRKTVGNISAAWSTTTSEDDLEAIVGASPINAGHLKMLQGELS